MLVFGLALGYRRLTTGGFGSTLVLILTGGRSNLSGGRLSCRLPVVDFDPRVEVDFRRLNELVFDGCVPFLT